jgi:hypothetical protein
MNLDTLQALAATVLALSAANERLVEVVKSLLGAWLRPASGKTVDSPATSSGAEKRRQALVLLVSIVAAWLTASLVAWLTPAYHIKSLASGLTGNMSIGSAQAPVVLPTFIMGLMTSAGSAFWNSVLDFVKAARQLKQATAVQTMPSN